MIGLLHWMAEIKIRLKGVNLCWNEDGVNWADFMLERSCVERSFISGWGREKKYNIYLNLTKWLINLKEGIFAEWNKQTILFPYSELNLNLAKVHSVALQILSKKLWLVYHD